MVKENTMNIFGDKKTTKMITISKIKVSFNVKIECL